MESFQFNNQFIAKQNFVEMSLVLQFYFYF